MNVEAGERRVSGRRWVLKVGSALLVHDDGRLRADWLAALAADVAALVRDGRELVIVSSGAIALGIRALGVARATARLPEQQAAAAIGQIRLANAWHDALGRFGLTTAQILLTAGDTENRRRYLNALDTFSTLLGQRAIPIVNENDTVATDEIRYGDNDRLAARIAQMLDADTLLLMSDVDGLYSAPPGQAGAEHVAEVAHIDERIERMVGGARSHHGTGGMGSKLAAARLATGAGADVYICDGRGLHALQRFADGARATHFAARGRAGEARKRWIAAALEPAGTLVLDAGAARAVAAAASLLPVGVVAVHGDFRRGDTVRLCNDSGAELGRGLVAYDADEARRISGRKSADIEAVLGYAGRPTLVHRDDLVLTGAMAAGAGERRHG